MSFIKEEEALALKLKERTEIEVRPARITAKETIEELKRVIDHRLSLVELILILEKGLKRAVDDAVTHETTIKSGKAYSELKNLQKFLEKIESKRSQRNRKAKKKIDKLHQEVEKKSTKAIKEFDKVIKKGK